MANKYIGITLLESDPEVSMSSLASYLGAPVHLLRDCGGGGTGGCYTISRGVGGGILGIVKVEGCNDKSKGTTIDG